MRQEPEHPICVRSLQQFLDLSDPEPAFLLEPWLRQRDINMTYAPTGVGKSMFAVSVGLAVAGGGRLFSWRAPQPRRVLIVDGEMDKVDLQERFRQLLPTIPEIDKEAARQNLHTCAYHDQPLKVRFPDFAQADGHERVLEVIDKHEPELVILDNYSTLGTIDEENEAGSFNPFQDLLREIKKRGAATILIHHSNKAKSGYRGTSKMGVLCNHIVRLEETSEAALHEGACFSVVWEKYRRKRDERTWGFSARLTDKGWTHEVDEDERLSSLVDLVAKGRFATQREIAEKLGWTEVQVSRARKKAIQMGIVTKEEWAGHLRSARLRQQDADQPDWAFDEDEFEDEFEHEFEDDDDADF